MEQNKMTNDKPRLRIEIPTTRSGIDNRAAYRKFVEEGDKVPETSGEGTRTSQVIPNKEGMIYVLSVNVYFAKERSHLGLNWNETYEALASEGKRMPTIPEFRNYLKYLSEDSDLNNGFQEIYDEITKVREPWRAEWIDAYFEKRKDGFYVLTGNKTKSEKLEDYLTSDKTPGINLDDWVYGTNVTNQGLPKTKSKKGDLYYWYPRNERVARFDASSAWAGLGCYRSPVGVDSSLGVFAVLDGEARGQ